MATESSTDNGWTVAGPACSSARCLAITEGKSEPPADLGCWISGPASAFLMTTSVRPPVL